MIAGSHTQVENIGMDINSLTMVSCRVCEACAHAFSQEEALQDLSQTVCFPGCENCNNLRHSCDSKPAVPKGGRCNDRLHICPFEGNIWWQFNTHFHLWKQVTSGAEWKALQSQPPRWIEEYQSRDDCAY